MTFVILATGPSLTQQAVDSVRGRASVIAISDAIRLAPWALALVAADLAWWRHHQPDFAGRRFAAGVAPGAERLPGTPTNLNSGALAVRVARYLGAKRIVLLGYDGHGSHFFGEHPAPLKNTSEAQRKKHAEQHRQEAFACRFHGVEIFNCSPGTAYTCYPLATLEEVLC